MTRRVFFSFHFENDFSRANNIRQAWRFRADHEANPMVDKAGWEKVKRDGDAAITSWINQALNGCSVTVVLIGTETYQRPWIHYEIAKSFYDKKGVFGICLSGMKGLDQKSFSPGQNPFLAARRAYQNKYPIPDYPIYSWARGDGRNNFESWVSAAAQAAGR